MNRELDAHSLARARPMNERQQQPRILVVDDEHTNVLLLERLLERWGHTDVVSTTQSRDVVALCATAEPDLIMLDLQMPDPDGFEVMRQLRPWRQAGVLVPILVITADVTTATRQRALAEGANDFLTKPFEPTEVRLRMGNLLEMRRLHLDLAHQNRTLEERVRERTRDLEEARLEILERLALAAEFRDDDTQQHAQRIGRTAGLLARRLGVPEATTELIRRAAPLHDIGKIAVPDAILLKPGPLTEQEFEVVRGHARIGAEMLSGSRSTVIRMAETIAMTHHERWDGHGYPHGLVKDDIPLAGRIVAVADVFDALAHPRPYKPAWPLDEVVAEIEAQAGRHFDPAVVDAFAGLDHRRLLDPVGPTARQMPETGPVTLTAPAEQVRS